MNIEWVEMRSMRSMNFVVSVGLLLFSEGTKKNTGVAMQIEESIL